MPSRNRAPRIVAPSAVLRQLLAADQEAHADLAGIGHVGFQVTTDGQGERSYTITENDFKYVLIRFAESMVDRGYFEASRPSGRSKVDKVTEAAAAAAPVGPVAADILGVEPGIPAAALQGDVFTVLRELSDLTEPRYSCDCQVGGVDATSIDADYLADLAHSARALITRLLGRTADAGDLTGVDAKLAIAAETFDRIFAVADQAEAVERDATERAQTLETKELADFYRRKLTAMSDRFDTVKSLIQGMCQAGLSFASPWEPHVTVAYGIPTGAAGTYDVYDSVDNARNVRDGDGYLTGKVAHDAPPIVRITTVELPESHRATTRHVTMRRPASSSTNVPGQA